MKGDFRDSDLRRFFFFLFLRLFLEFLEVSEFWGTAQSPADELAASDRAPASKEAQGQLELLHLAGTAT